VSDAAALPSDVETPCLVVDATVLESNLRSMAEQAHQRGIALRPHAKTHKCVEIAHRQVELGAAGLTVATVGEAEVFVRAGINDLFIAFPIWAAGARGARLRAVAEQAKVRVGVDSVEAAAVLGRAVSGLDVEVAIEINSGHDRSGVLPEDAGRVAVAAARAGLTVVGIFTFPGHGYGPQLRQQAAADEARALRDADAALRSVGIEPTLRSGGSTPTAALTDGASVTEMRPGVYVFNDAQQLELGAATWNDIALTAAGTVVSRSGRNLILDVGSKVLGADRAPWASGGGRLPEYPDARIVALSEHHATVALPDGTPAPELGTVLRVAPNHVCAAVNLVDELAVYADGAWVGNWRVAARGRNG